METSLLSGLYSAHTGDNGKEHAKLLHYDFKGSADWRIACSPWCKVSCGNLEFRALGGTIISLCGVGILLWTPRKVEDLGGFYQWQKIRPVPSSMQCANRRPNPFPPKALNAPTLNC